MHNGVPDNDPQWLEGNYLTNVQFEGELLSQPNLNLNLSWEWPHNGLDHPTTQPNQPMKLCSCCCAAGQVTYSKKLGAELCQAQVKLD